VKLASYRVNEETRLGVVAGDRLVDLAAAAAAAALDGGSPTMFRSMAAFLATGPAARGVATTVMEHWAEKQSGRNSLPLPEVQWAVPLAAPGKLLCIGLNYADHCREQDVPEPDNPLLFAKFNTALLPHGGQIRWPADLTQQVDYEAELAVIIGREARDVAETDAMDHVFGYTIVNDVSARDVQFSDKQWVRGKSFDTFCPCGPVVVTADEIPDPHQLAIRCRVNGQTLQDSNTGEMIFKIPHLIAYISRAITLQPGDIISTGTPHGVGMYRAPQVFLKVGDRVEVEIESIGVLANTVA
jgi:2-keto-4-pentenoate hydratase/2-oxohepta-3-ene-1,7-dioic acid hydratase in catechol pathway